MPTIKQWNEIADGYKETLLLGNGASVAMDPCFAYCSLKEAAEADGLITPNVQKLFDYFQTEDFEFVMAMIWHANQVNSALNLPEKLTGEAYREVQKALVGAVRDKHAPAASVRAHFPAIGAFMKRFKTVFSLNYDLIVYWTILEVNTSLKQKWFKDCFIEGEFRDDWKELRKPYGSAPGATLVLYPHGNLALTTSLQGEERKVHLRYVGQDLLAAVLRAWESERRRPLFVSEGTSAQKRLAIQRSRYLTTVYQDVMSNMGESCAIYGWSLGENDSHILERICQTGVRHLAISIFRGNDKIASDCERMVSSVNQFSEGRISIEFFWSDSENCWTKAEVEQLNGYAKGA